MSKRLLGAGTLAALLVLFFAINILSNTALRGARIDLTQDKLYTLSEGARAIARGIDEPISLTFYFSRSLAVDRPDLRGRAARVQEALEEFVRESGGKIRLRIVHPEPFSEEEEQAAQAGLEGEPVSDKGDVVFLGLVGTNSTNGREVIPRFMPDSERLLEYDLARMIQTLRTAENEKPKIGVLSTVGMQTFAMDPSTGRPVPKNKWRFFLEPLKDFRVEELAATMTEVPPDVSVVVLVHPKGLGDETLYALDQFVMRGGKLVIFVDPLAATDDSIQARDQMQLMMADRSSNLDKLLNAWGVEVVKEKVVLDKQLAPTRQFPQEGRVVELSQLQYLMVRGEALSKDDPVTREMDMPINMFFAGAIRRKAEAKAPMLEIEPIIQSTTESMLIDRAEVQFAQSPTQLIERFAPAGERLTLGARLRGKVSSAFAEGPPKPVDGPAPDASKHLAQSKDEVSIVLIADVDMANDGAWVQEANLGQQRYIIPFAGNGELLRRAVASLQGSAELMSIRPRGQFRRPFDRVQEIRKSAEQAFLERVRDAESKVRQAEERLTQALQSKQPRADGTIDLTPDLDEKIKAFQQEQADAKRALRAVLRERDKDIAALERKIKAINIAAVPAVVSLTAIGLGLYRSGRRSAAKKAA